MTKTITDLVTRTLEDRGITGAGESITASDHAKVKDAYLTDLEELRDLGLAYWPDNEIPDAIIRGLSVRLGLIVGPAFGYPMANDQQMTESLRPLRRHIQKRRSGEPVRAEYF